MPRILIADDQSDVLDALRLLFKEDGYELLTATSPAAIITERDGDEEHRHRGAGEAVERTDAQE